MTEAIATRPSLSLEHREAYFKVLSKITRRAELGNSMRYTLGNHGLELVAKQLRALETVNAGYDVQFDTRREAVELHGIFMDNFKYVETKIQAFRDELQVTLERFETLINQEHYLPWLTDVGRALVQRPLLLAPVVKRELALIPLRVYAMRATVIATGEAIRDASPGAFEYALHCLTESFANYVLDCKYLQRQLAPEFMTHATSMFEVYESIDKRIEEREIRIAREAQEQAELDAAARAREADERDHYNVSSVRYVPADTYVPFSDSNDYDYDWSPSINPANGMPMMGDSMFDVTGHCYGTSD